MTRLTISDEATRSLLLRVVWNHSVRVLTNDCQGLSGLEVEFWDGDDNLERHRADMTARVESWQRLNKRIQELRTAEIGSDVPAPLSAALLTESLNSFRQAFEENADVALRASARDRASMLGMYDAVPDLLEQLVAVVAVAS